MTAKLTEITLESDILERRKALDEFSKNFKLELTTFTTQKAEFDKIINKTAVLEI
ncbi:MAG: hypothetical protein LBU14_00750 [Candidatus Peribacteria bacterium]|jgi:hypothetical protein|nr:hypothetical protein [Candidatus Peribacteria bacterium]